MTPTRANILMYDDGGTLGFLVTDNNIQPQLVAGAVLRLALGKWGVHVHTPLLYRTSLAHSLLTGYDTTYMLIYSFHSVCLWFSATLCSQDATSGDTSPLYRRHDNCPDQADNELRLAGPWLAWSGSSTRVIYQQQQHIHLIIKTRRDGNHN